MDSKPFFVSNWFMPRCVSCHGVVTKYDAVCYGCGDPVPKFHRTFEPKRISKASNIAFIASIGLTVYSFVSPHKMSLWTSVALSGSILLVRIIADRIAAKQAAAGSERTLLHSDQPGFHGGPRLRSQGYRTRG